jgi:hypothetical protein
MLKLDQPSFRLVEKHYLLPVPSLCPSPMKAYEILNSAEDWSHQSPVKVGRGNQLEAFDPHAENWCVLAAIQKAYPPSQWEQAMDRLLRALSVSEQGLARMSKYDKACCLMEWSDDCRSSFLEVREILCSADI